MFCARCRREIDPADLQRSFDGKTETLTCPRCDGIFMQHESRVVKPLVPELATAFIYPFRAVTLIVSLIVMVIAGAVGFIPVVGGFIATGVRFAWLFAILRSSSDGEEDVAVDPTDISGTIFGWVGPGIRFFLTCFVAFLPALIATSALGTPSSLLVGAMGVIGILYLPAGVIAAAEANTWFAPLNPVPSVKLIARIPGAYFIACAMLLVLFGISGAMIAAAIAAAEIIAVPFAGNILAEMLGYLPLVAAARMLGLLVYEKREEL